MLDDSFMTATPDLDGPLGPLSSAGGADAGGSPGVAGSSATAGAAAVTGSGGASGAGGSLVELPDASQPACVWTPFGAPELLSGLGLGATASQWGPTLAPDAATLILSSSLPGGYDNLYQATRGDRGAMFSAAIALTSLNTSANTGTPFLSFDSSRLYFYSDRSGGVGARDLYVSTRPSVLDTFQSASLVGGVNSAASDHLPWLSPDELTIYFTSARAGGAGGYDLWTATRATRDGSFTSLKRLSELDTPGNDEGATLMADELTIFFASDRADGAGELDIWMSTRASKADAFVAPVNLTVLNSAANDMNAAISADGRELFFSSDRGAGTSPPHLLWRSIRSCQ